MILLVFMGFYQDDEMFTFRFNLVMVRDDEEVSYALSETCSPSLPWSPREVTCEANYMEVSLAPKRGALFFSLVNGSDGEMKPH